MMLRKLAETVRDHPGSNWTGYADALALAEAVLSDERCTCPCHQDPDVYCEQCCEGPAVGDADRTVASIAAMLGWGNVPPRATLEREIAALKARAAVTREAVAAAELLAQWDDRARLYDNLKQHDRCAEVSRCALELRVLDIPIRLDSTMPKDEIRIERAKHKTSCRAYSNYQPPYEDCTCGAESGR